MSLTLTKMIIFQSTDVEGSWICFDFKSSRIVPTNYQIKNSNNVVNPKTWVIEGKTDDNSQWVNIGGESNCSYLKDSNVSHIFPITNPNGKEFRYIRMRQTGPNWLSSHYLTIGSFELYGALIE